ncbi:ATP-binding cassette domain-containing protein [Maribellus comscasis]|uniref:ATP-binding cassette domain-containing protein n=1 Tax=Maribellus comscasis TaxID=2681766 RepID=A0A6I6JKM9_9BACT|nr:ATP-binding cassette domain-containing protein [Maribellus comscasis]QGY43405.1 ATP-binding cassette domain-containing protein [Maribellus comscasis]
MNHILEADSIIFEYGQRRVLADVYLQCKTGETLGILGRNGSGKSTLLRIIFGDLQTYNKSVRIDGRTIHEAYKGNGLISYLPQFNFLPKSIPIKRIFNHFQLDFSDFLKYFNQFDRYYKSGVNKLSGGEIRILELYLILTIQSMFCMLDEPFTHIMPAHVEIVKSLIQREKQNKGIILVDHYYNDILDVSDKIILLHNAATIPVKGKLDLKQLGYIY